ncbi:PLP-dependent aminotransferase family protein [Paenibacillus psychroresistens]|uniref:PLP-dependent aminotransferase family protein n=1 Tax=Paenibacillus psychroresistens TaxID=1778678 RepID=A0A6B8REW3_9BACL|nr:PLP-dependent aminotransferase family protein [Paenibacillus psychroresistens]QGQ94095.1 PLP-dependent aminotransferase family protein [Paenibacillus psychroresistens]
MTWKPQPNTEMPIFRQIFHYYENQIINGMLTPGAKFPAERELAAMFSVNRSTISAAFEELRAAGLVATKVGSGTRVSELMWETKPYHSPNWQRYTINRMYDPGLILQNQIHKAASKPNMINMTKGELSPDLMPLEFLKKLSSQLDFTQPYSYHDNFLGDPKLRGSLIEHLAKQQIHTSTQQLLVTSGVKHSLHLIAHTLLQPGEAIAVEGPSYLYAMQVFTAAGLRMVKIPMDANGLIPEAIPELYHKYRIRMVFTNPTFHNPTGTTLSLERRRALLAICEQLRLPIIEDDPYGMLHLDSPQTPPPALRALPSGEHSVIYLGTMSKFVTPGMRLGWIVAPLEVINKLAEAKNRTGYSSSHAGERLAQLYLDSPSADTQLNLILLALISRRKVLLSTLQDQMAHYATLAAPYIPAGGFYVWLKLKTPVPDRIIIEACINQGVLVYPGSIYGAEKGFFRLTYASIGESEIVEGVRRIKAALKRLQVKGDL